MKCSKIAYFTKRNRGFGIDSGTIAAA